MPQDSASLDAAFEALAGFDWGKDAAPLGTIDAAIVSAHGDDAARDGLEKRLTALLATGAAQAAKEYACRKLCLVGSTASVPALAALLAQKDLSHMARFALERIEAPEAAAALRSGLESLDGDLRIGVIGSLGSRRDAGSVPSLGRLLKGDPRTATAAAVALGSIRTPEALAALSLADPFAGHGLGEAVVDARLACAEELLGRGRRAEALAVYDALLQAASGRPEARRMELAATRGRLACLDAVASGA
jgi:GNAT superfamily N-acetyltransferase